MRDELETLMNQADAIAGGQTPASPAPASGARPHRRRGRRQTGLNELQRTLDRSAQRSDEALQRSEMALQQVRRLAAEIGAIQSEAQGRSGRTELTRTCRAGAGPQ